MSHRMVGKLSFGRSQWDQGIALHLKRLKYCQDCGIGFANLYAERTTDGRTVRLWKVNQTGAICLTFTLSPWFRVLDALRTSQWVVGSVIRQYRRE